MQTFDDSSGRKWLIKLTIGRASTLRDAGFDLVDDNSKAAILDDPLKMYQLACLLLADQAKERDVNEDALDQVLTDCFPAYLEAFVEELATFCRNLGLTAQAKIHQAVLAATRRAQEMAASKVDEVDIPALIGRELDRAAKEIDLELVRLSGETSGEQPALQESIPDR